MTKPSDAAVTVRYDSAMQAWSVASAEPGPAGSISALLGEGIRLAVDAIEPDRLVELAVALGPDGAVPPDSVSLVRALLGSEIADHIANSAPHEDPVAATAASGEVLAAAAALAHTTMLQSLSATRHVLRELDIILNSFRIGHASLDDQTTRTAWALWPSLVSMARTCADPTALVAIPREQRDALRTRLGIVQRILLADPAAGDLGESRGYALVSRLMDDLQLHLGSEPTRARRRTVQHEQEAVGALPSHGLRFRGAPDPDAPRDVSWSGHTDDFAGRLGSLLRLLHDSTITATGELPGVLTVTLPIELGVTTSDLSDIAVRALTPDGQLLGEGSLEVVQPERAALPTATAVLTLTAPDNASPSPTIELDIGATYLPPLSGAALARQVRRRSVRAGQAAVAADAAGEYGTSAAYWAECAGHLRSVGETKLADRAQAQAVAARNRDAQFTPTAQLDERDDWLTMVLDGWAQWARSEIESASLDVPNPTIDPLDRARALIEALSGWNDPSAELADAHVKVAELLQASRDGDDDDAEYHWREALRINYSLNRATEALMCMRALNEIPSPD